jgi:hypothetical protein
MILVAILAVSVVYALGTGVLTFKGDVTLSPETKLEIVEYANEVNYEDNGSFGTFKVIDGKTATIEVTLFAPGDLIEFPFAIKNTGLTKAIIENIDIKPEFKDEDYFVDIYLDNEDFDMDDLNEFVIEVGSVVETFFIVVEWVDTVEYDDTPDLERTFEITIEYGLAS